MIHATLRGAALLLVVGGAGLGLLSGCSSASSSDATNSPTPTQGTPSSSVPDKATTSAGSAASPATSECTEASILAALPAGSTMDNYQCEIASPWMWAAARVKPGPTVFFLQTTSGPWTVSTAKQICGKPPAGLPKEIKAFCPNT